MPLASMFAWRGAPLSQLRAHVTRTMVDPGASRTTGRQQANLNLSLVNVLSTCTLATLYALVLPLR